MMATMALQTSCHNHDRQLVLRLSALRPYRASLQHLKLVPLTQLSLPLMQALQQQLAELETKLVQARTDSKAQVKGHNTGKKELEVSFLLHLITCLHTLLCAACYTRQSRRLLHLNTACRKSVGWPC